MSHLPLHGPVAEHFHSIVDSDETLYWVGRPNLLSFMWRGVPFFILGSVWGLIDLTIWLLAIRSKHQGSLVALSFVIFLHGAPFYLSVINLIRLRLVYHNVFFAISSKRVLFRRGLFGAEFEAIDFDRIQDIAVQIRLIDRILKTGSVRIFAGRVSSRGAGLSSDFVGISDVYDVFKQLKEISTNVKTDWNYPNALRPVSNEGYKTKYTGTK